MSDVRFIPKEMTRFRTPERACMYMSDYNAESILYACQIRGISPEKVCKTLHRFAKLRIPPRRIWGCFRIVFQLDKPTDNTPGIVWN